MGPPHRFGAFGVVLYEMLTAKRLFTGESAVDVLAAVVLAEPDWNALPASRLHRCGGC